MDFSNWGFWQVAFAVIFGLGTLIVGIVGLRYARGEKRGMMYEVLFWSTIIPRVREDVQNRAWFISMQKHLYN